MFVYLPSGEVTPSSSHPVCRRNASRTSSAPSYLRGRDRYASAAGPTATFRTARRASAGLATIGPTRGSARVYVNGVLVKTVSLHATTTASRRLVFRITWSAAASRTIVIRVVGTAGHPRVDLARVGTWD